MPEDLGEAGPIPVHSAYARPVRALRCRSAALAAGISAAAVVTASPAAAAPTEWSDWKPLPAAEPFDSKACGTTVRLSTEVNKEVGRERKDKAGNTHIEFKGRLTVRITDLVAGKSVVVDASGASLGRYHSISCEDGAYL